ncbi:Putative uncharacterized protein [Taphrina deformans PYCC 5710]|uniref:Nodulin-like domain-containing protein n=1 Tax=Taphrina deformans (strain PYCC 5710 / ATCC 11124 / CBS 356.35 / IMI 108563 / JCM 9778 / NBRC 8474) TaxID=1097556 RepID=R4X9V6_TAPDE|nr:Putative uncharacterized protein [Taphrina deformans PYCC 5710]|eukprot:CCG81024.1 Putative uncharacterized protein [Taphrina deformans PYCC 5710]
MSQRCGLTAMAINMVGVSGNLGVYLISPFAGKLVDKTGQRLALLLSSLSLFSGYYGLHWLYVNATKGSVNPVTLCFYSFLTGVGSSLGNSATLNACAKSFPDNRGTSTAFPIAMYGLSAFLFSRISYMFFTGRTDQFLLLLAVSCGLALFVSSIFVGVYDKSVVYSGLLGTRKLSDDSTTSERNGLLRSIHSSSTDASVNSRVLSELTGWELIHNRDFLLMITTIALR